MAKTVNLPEKIYDDLVKVAEELTLMAKKPISQSMAINLLIEVYHAHTITAVRLTLSASN